MSAMQEREPTNGFEASTAPKTSEQQELTDSIDQIADIASELGLDPFPTMFHVVDAKTMYQLGAYGMQNRFSHWRNGANYYRQKTSYDYGRSKIYELVMNSDVAHAYLLANNPLIDNKMVIAHVFGHTDFFKNNPAFSDTDRHMNLTGALHAQRIREYEFAHGELEVERFIDAALSLEWNIDPYTQRSWDMDEYRRDQNALYEARCKPQTIESDYDDLLTLGEKKIIDSPPARNFPEAPEQDLLGFISAFSPKGLEDWQQDILNIIREENYYFAPNILTKIMNEGWAVFWHTRIMREMADRGHLDTGEVIDWTSLHTGVTVPNFKVINPYYIGWRIWEDIEAKYKGVTDPTKKRDRDWQGEEIDPDNYVGNPSFDVFNVRSDTPSDEAFFRNYLTPELMKELNIYEFGMQEKQGGYGTSYKQWIVEEDEGHIFKDRFICSFTNLQQPTIKVDVGGGDYNGNRELYLTHCFDGREIDFEKTKRTLRAVYTLWGRPVHLETVIENTQGSENKLRKVVLSFNGQDFEGSTIKDL